ncbi:MAG: response regulator transcription factor [Anaerolineae bacterium]|nr:response regulator transcription factor [Anaerolineae bacterium]
MTKQTTILVVDDEMTVREVVRQYLEHAGFHVDEAGTGTEALAYLQSRTPDLVVLDIMLPGVDGFAITRALRGSGRLSTPTANNNTPVILLTARTSELDRIAGFELGADDYVVKPFSPRELVARVKAVLRRTGGAAADVDEKPIAFAELSIDPLSHEVHVRGASVVLTAKEFDLLLFLARHPRQVFTRTQLLDQIWGYEFYGDESTVTVHIRRLREKIEANPGEPGYIQTVWGVGYKFEP